MIRYRYASEVHPPAPYIKVTVCCPTTGQCTEGVLAQIDSAADRTVFPGPLVDSLKLLQGGMEAFQGFGSTVIQLPIYLAEVRIHDFPPIKVAAVSGEREPYVLLGRDVLNEFRLLLDGPQLALEIG